VLFGRLDLSLFPREISVKQIDGPACGRYNCAVQPHSTGGLMSFRRAERLCFVLMMALAVPIAALAQGQTGSIAGVVKDSTGAVLPGVTVEAASPALIEKVRTVVTDGQGAYKIIDLRPGVYTVTFTLTGFSAFKREGIELT